LICNESYQAVAAKRDNDATWSDRKKPARSGPFSVYAKMRSRFRQLPALATGNQNQKATGDAVAFTVGMVVFWPALFLMHGDGAEAGQVANLKGQMQALEIASAQKGCGIVFQQPKAEPKQAKQGQTPYP
jgi:hypothetical protein